MRRIGKLATLGGMVLVVLSLSVTAAAAQTTYPPDSTAPTVSNSAPDPGDCVTVSATATPGATVNFVFTDADGTTTTVTAVADANGVATVELCVPTDAATGAGTIVATAGGAVLGQVAVSVGTAQDGGLAITGRTVGTTAGVAVLAVVVGAVLLALSRRREGVAS